MDESMHHIGTVARRTAMSLRTVRYYEEVGLVRPSGRSEGGFRLYTEADVQRLLLVRALRPAELGNPELAELLELHERIAQADGDGGALGMGESQARLGSLLDAAAERIRHKRERLIAAELAVELLRDARPRASEPGTPEPGTPEPRA